MQRIDKWLKDHHECAPEAVEAMIKKHQKKIVKKLTEHKGELSDFGEEIFDAAKELKPKFNNPQK